MKKRKGDNILKLVGIWFPFLTVLVVFYNRENNFHIVFTYLILLLLIVFFSKLFNKKNLYLSIFTLGTILFSSLVFIDIAHYLVFKNGITSSTIYILLETNKIESKEFIREYLMNIKFIFIFILFLLAVIVGFLFSNFKFQRKKVNDRQQKVNFLFVIVCLIFMIPFRYYFWPYLALHSLNEFIKERKELAKFPIKKNGDFINVSIKSDEIKKTYVVIIGESTTKTHMGIYNYYRQTNPLLKRRKSNGLTVFNNVRSPHTHTITSLREVLTLGDKSSSKIFNNTIVQLFNKAGFNTYFISNQTPIGKYETTVTLLTKASDTSIFTNVSNTRYDAEILSPLKKVLKNDSDNKFIMIHLMGTHSRYINRYPTSFDVFNDKPRTVFEHELAYKTINNYDNAVLYNDFIVDSIIKEIDKEESNAFVVYFSDHGEDVFETINLACHTETRGTNPMYKIPFIIWISKKYQTSRPNLSWDINKAYNSKNLIFTIADLANIKFDKFDKSKSIVADNTIK